MREGGWNCLKYLKRGWNRKEGRGNKDFKKGCKLVQGFGALKRGGGGGGGGGGGQGGGGGGWNPLTNYVWIQKI